MDAEERSDVNNSERLRMAERLRATREYLGYSQDEVAKHLGVPRTALVNVEKGTRGLDALELKRLASLYGKPVAFFTDGAVGTGPALPADVEHLARKASELSEHDRSELSRFADFLRQRGKKE